MILRQILKHTPADSQEASDIIEALVRVESCLDVLNDLTDKEERRLQLRELQDRMFYKSGGISVGPLLDLANLVAIRPSRREPRDRPRGLPAEAAVWPTPAAVPV